MKKTNTIYEKFRHNFGKFIKRDNGVNARLASWSSWLDGGRGGRKVIVGDRIDEPTSLTVPTVLACTKIIAETVGTLPCVLYQPDGRGRVPAFKEDEYSLMHDAPNDRDTACEYHENVLTSLILNGNSYAYCEQNDRGRNTAVWPLQNEQVNVRIVNGQVAYSTYAIDGTQSILFNGYDMFHTKVFSRNGVTGSSMVRQAAELFGQSLCQNEFGSSIYKNNATISGVVSTDYDFSDTSEMDNLRDQLKKSYAGSENAGKVMFLPYNLQFKPITMTPEDMMMVETMKMTIRQIAALFGVPSHMLQQIDKGTFNTVEQQGLEFIQLCIRKWCIRYEQSMNQRLLNQGQRQRGLHFKFDLRDLLRGDTASRSTYYNGMLVNGVMTRNEVRILEDMNPIDGLDEILTPMNYSATPEDSDDESVDVEDDPNEDGGSAPKKAKKVKAAPASSPAVVAQQPTKPKTTPAKKTARAWHVDGIEVAEEVLTEAIADIMRKEHIVIQKQDAGAINKFYSGHRKYVAAKIEKPLSRVCRLQEVEMTQVMLDAASSQVAQWYAAARSQAKGDLILDELVNGAAETVLQLVGAEI